PGRIFPSLLVRELARQSILLAAREGLDLTTRDGVLREAPPTGPGSAEARLRLDVDYLKEHSLLYDVVDESAGERHLLDDQWQIPGQASTCPDLLPLIQEAEARSRGRYV